MYYRKSYPYRYLLSVIMTKAEKKLAIRWINLLIGLWQLYYYVNSGGILLLVISILNIGVWAMMRGKSSYFLST